MTYVTDNFQQNKFWKITLKVCTLERRATSAIIAWRKPFIKHVHRQEKDHTCLICNRSFSMKRNLARHERAIHLKTCSAKCWVREDYFLEVTTELCRKKELFLLSTSLAWPAVAGCSRAETFSQLSSITFSLPCSLYWIYMREKKMMESIDMPKICTNS